MHRIEFDDDTNTIKCHAVYAHSAGEVWSMAPSPSSAQLVMTAYRTATPAAASTASTAGASAAATASPASVTEAEHKVSLWRMKEEKNEPVTHNSSALLLPCFLLTSATILQVSKLEEVVELKGHSGSVRGLVWGSDESRVVTCDAQAVRLWTLNTGAVTAAVCISAPIHALPPSDSSFFPLFGFDDNCFLRRPRLPAATRL